MFVCGFNMYVQLYLSIREEAIIIMGFNQFLLINSVRIFKKSLRDLNL